MAYIGKSIESGTFSVLDTSGNTYNGSNVTFSLGTQVGSPAQLLVSHDGVIQKPGTDYSLATGGTQITFSTAPASGASIFIVEISGAVGGPLDSDLNGTELILDADGDTSITADTDDQIDVKIAGADDFKFSANAMNVLSGSTLTIDSGATITNSGTANGFGTDPDGAQVFNDSGAAVDFRVESDNNANMLVVDGSTDCIAIGQAAGSSSYELDIAGDIRLYNSGDGFETIDFDSNRGSAGDFLGDITGKWNGTDVARISLRAGSDTTNKDDGAVVFEVASAGTLVETFRVIPRNNLCVAKTSDSFGTAGHTLYAESGSEGATEHTTSGIRTLSLNRLADDGEIIGLFQAGSKEGTISVSGSTISYNTFCGTHWSRLADNSKPTILRGTVIESISTMMTWYQAVADVAESTDSDGNVTPAHNVKESIILPDGKSVGDAVTFTSQGKEYTGKYVKEDNEQLPMCKISNTEESKGVYGVFMTWDDTDNGLDGDVNDMYVASLGAFVVRIHKDETVAIGDYLQSKGDGTAKKQADDILRASTIAKVTSTEKTHEYADGSYCVPCTLHCG
jgi:hypothetical protein